MQVSIRGERIKPGTELREYISRRLQFALGRFGSAIQRVNVRVGDLNGPRGGIDKRCHILVQLRASGGSPITVDTDDSDLCAAVDRAAERIGRSVTRALERKRQRGASQRRRASVEDEELAHQ
jgi:putative sigma-54 modulation protein